MKLLKELELIKMNLQILTRLSKRDQKDLGIYLSSTRVYKELMNQYWPISTIDEQERLTRTANKVGFQLPNTYSSSDSVKDNK